MCPSSDPGQSAPRIILEVDRAGGGQDRIVSGMHSYVDNWYQLMGLLAFPSNSVGVTDTQGQGQNITNRDPNTWDDDTGGIQSVVKIGDGSKQFNQGDLKLDNRVAADDITNRAIEPSNQLIRISGSLSISQTATIREVGLFYQSVVDSSGNTFQMMIERTVLDETTDVVNGDTVSVTYELTWTAP